MKLFCRTYGRGEPLVILHGFLGCSDNWHTLAGRLGGRFRVLVPDLRNHGRSPHASGFGIPELAGDIRRLLDDHGIGRAALLGHSLGGKAAMRLALDAPERIERIAVADIAPRAYPPRTFPEVDAMLALDRATLASRADADAALAAAVPDAAVRGLLLKNLERGDDGRLRWRCNLAALARHAARILEPVDGPPFPGPALFLRGGRSDYVTDADLPAIRRLFPRAESAIIPGAGHWLHADAPDAVLEQLLRFLGE